MGYPVQIHFGVMKDETGFQGHSWVTLEGKAVAEYCPEWNIQSRVFAPFSAPSFSLFRSQRIKEIKNEHQFSEA